MIAVNLFHATGLPVLAPGPWQTAAFCAGVVAVARALEGVLRMPRRLWTGVLAWQAAVGALAWSGHFQHFDAPGRALPLLALGCFAAGWLATRPFGGRGQWLVQAPVAAWVAVQGFRLPLELWLYSLYSTGVMGRQLTFVGANADIAIGLSAPFLAAIAHRQLKRGPMSAGLRGVLLAWNVVGLVLLFNVVLIAVLSLPFSFRQFTQGPGSAFVTTFPFVWLPTLLVPLALMGHVVSIRRTWSVRSQLLFAASARTP
jgi:hypothetical protein